MADAKRDQNSVPAMLGVSDLDGTTLLPVLINPTTGRILLSAVMSGSVGTVTTVSVVSANGFAGTVANATTTPAITLSTTITGLLKGNGTAISAAVAGTDYQAPLGFTPEDVANKSTNVITDGSSDTKYPSVKAVKTYADGLVVGLLDYRGSYDASGNTYPATGGSGTAGAIMKGDMWIISVAGTLGGTAVQIGDSVIANVDTPGQTAGNWNILNGNISYVPEDVANKVASISGASTDTQYPSAKLLYDQLAGKQATMTVATGTEVDTGTDNVKYVTPKAMEDSSYIKEVVQDTTPQLGGQLDVNGNSLGDGTLELLKFTETASAVNEFTIKNAATNNAPELQATGDDTNIDLKLVPKGTGIVKGERKIFQVRLIDSATDLTTGTSKGGDFRISPLRAITIKAVGAYVDTAATGANLLTIDINEAGTSILSTKITLDASEKTSTTAATAPVISDSAIAADAIITFDIDQVGNTTAGKGLVVWVEYEWS